MGKINVSCSSHWKEIPLTSLEFDVEVLALVDNQLNLIQNAKPHWIDTLKENKRIDDNYILKISFLISVNILICSINELRDNRDRSDL